MSTRFISRSITPTELGKYYHCFIYTGVMQMGDPTNIKVHYAKCHTKELAEQYFSTYFVKYLRNIPSDSGLVVIPRYWLPPNEQLPPPTEL